MRSAFRLPPKKRGLPAWQPLGAYVLPVQTKKRTCAIFVTPVHGGTFGVAAVEVPIGPKEIGAMSNTQTADRVLDEHAHENIGEFKTVDLAVAAAEKYARRWLRSRPKSERCACKPIRMRAA